MKKILFVALVLIVLVGSLSGCKSKAETLEENLLSQDWAMVLADGSSATLTFYENHTAIANAKLVSVSYEWSLDDTQLTMIYKSYSTTCTLLFDIASDDESGYICTLLETSADETPAYYNAQNEEMYSTMKLTPNK